MTFPSLAELHDYALQRRLKLQPAEVARYDWDSVKRWCDEPVASGIVVGPFLNAWNMILDNCLLATSQACSRMLTAETALSTRSCFGRTIFPL